MEHLAYYGYKLLITILGSIHLLLKVETLDEGIPSVFSITHYPPSLHLFGLQRVSSSFEYPQFLRINTFYDTAVSR